MENDEGSEIAGLLFNPVLGAFIGGWAITIVLLYAFTKLSILSTMIFGFFVGLFCAYISYESSGIGPDID